MLFFPEIFNSVKTRVYNILGAMAINLAVFFAFSLCTLVLFAGVTPYRQLGLINRHAYV